MLILSSADSIDSSLLSLLIYCWIS